MAGRLSGCPAGRLAALLSDCLVWSGPVWSGLVRSSLVWSGLVWSGLVWSGRSVCYAPSRALSCARPSQQSGVSWMAPGSDSAIPCCPRGCSSLTRATGSEPRWRKAAAWHASSYQRRDHFALRAEQFCGLERAWQSCRGSFVARRARPRCHHGVATLCQTCSASLVWPPLLCMAGGCPLCGGTRPPTHSDRCAPPYPAPAMPMVNLTASQRVPRQPPRLCLGFATRGITCMDKVARAACSRSWPAVDTCIRRACMQACCEHSGFTAGRVQEGCSGNRARNLSHPRRGSCHETKQPVADRCLPCAEAGPGLGAAAHLRRKRGHPGASTQPPPPEHVSLGVQGAAIALAPGGGQQFPIHPIPSAWRKAGRRKLTLVGSRAVDSSVAT